ncbi:MAG: acyl-CoA thioesterase [Staphylococcus epidermidis]|nr:acyl-CoA thioesterase [Staphylococcus epidermidis]
MANTNRKSKKMSDAKCIKTRQVYPQDTNHHHTMFGGTLMANIDEIAAITAMKHAGSSMEICVQIVIDDVYKNERHLAALSFLTFVALDSDGKPTSVPDVEPETSVEKWFHETAPQRVARRKERRKESIDTIEYLSRVRHIEK